MKLVLFTGECVTGENYEELVTNLRKLDADLRDGDNQEYLDKIKRQYDLQEPFKVDNSGSKEFVESLVDNNMAKIFD